MEFAQHVGSILQKSAGLITLFCPDFHAPKLEQMKLGLDNNVRIS